MSKKGGAPQNLKPVRSKEEARKRGRNGGIKSGESRRNKKDARQAMKMLLEMSAKGTLDKNLQELGFDSVEERTNLMALQARLFTMAMSGNLSAYDKVMQIAGYDPEDVRKDKEERRKERESIAKDKRLDRESIAKVNQLEMSHEGSFGSSSSGGMSLDEDDEKDDVVIFMPYNGRQGTPPPKDSSTLSKYENNDVTDGGQDNGEDNT